MKWQMLLIDDDLCILDTLAELLAEDDIIVTKAKNGIEGLSLLKENKFDIVVSDLAMPGMDGGRMMVEAAAAGIFVPHVFFSAHFDHKLEQSLKIAGATAVVPKPHFEKLSVEINSVLMKKTMFADFGSSPKQPWHSQPCGASY